MTRQEKARSLRYKKAIVRDLNLFTIRNEIDEIMEECDNVQYWMDTDSETLINAMDGNEDEAYEFKMEFADLSAECYQMYEDFQNIGDYDLFDDIFVAIGGAEQGNGLMGWDSYEQDYFGLDLPTEWSEQESVKRLERLTKKELLENIAYAFRILMAYIGLRARYESLSAAMTLVKEQNTGHLQIVKEIEKLYCAAQESGEWSKASHKFDRLLSQMPEEAWL